MSSLPVRTNVPALRSGKRVECNKCGNTTAFEFSTKLAGYTPIYSAMETSAIGYHTDGHIYTFICLKCGAEYVWFEEDNKDEFF